MTRNTDLATPRTPAFPFPLPLPLPLLSGLAFASLLFLLPQKRAPPPRRNPPFLLLLRNPHTQSRSASTRKGTAPGSAGVTAQAVGPPSSDPSSSSRLIGIGSSLHRSPTDRPTDPRRMAEGDAPAAASAAAATSPQSPVPPETPSTLKRRQRGLVSRVWKGIFGGREDVEKLLQALSKEEEAVRARLRRRARASRQSAHNVLGLAAAVEVIPSIRFVRAGPASVSAGQSAVFMCDRWMNRNPLFLTREINAF